MFIAAFCFLAAGNLSAQTTQELNFNVIQNGNLRSGMELWYSIRPNDTGLVTVETSGNTDTYLEIYDAMGNLFDEDDDSGDGSNAKIKFFAEAGGAYLAKLRGFGNESGPFRIWAVLDVLPVPTELFFGNTVSGFLNQEDELWYSVYSAQEGFVTVMTSGNTDTYLEAHKSSYKTIEEDDDSREDQNATIELWAEGEKT